jgi:hypothetical protein
MGVDERRKRKMKRYRSLLAHFNKLAKNAEKEYKAGHITKKKMVRLIDKYNAKKSKVILKMKKVKSGY